MWGLFTRALTLGSSTVRVSVINTSANFMLTALLGLVIFSEQLPGKPLKILPCVPINVLTGLWWLGASFLVAGSVIIGRRDEGKDVGAAGTAGAEPAVTSTGRFSDEADAPLTGRASMSSDSDAGNGESIELRRKPR